MGILLYIVGVNLVKGMMWPDIDYNPFCSPWWVIPLFTAAGLAIGLIAHFVKFQEESIFDAMRTGRMDHSKVHWQLMNGFITLISGLSLGPESPAGLLAGGLTSWITKRRKFSREDGRDTFTASVSGAFGGLFNSPFVGVLMAMELSTPSKRDFTKVIAMDSIAAVSGFAIFYSIIGINPEIGFINLPPYELENWHIFLGMAFGMIGAFVGMMFLHTMKLTKKALAPLKNRPLVRCTMMGFLLGLLAFAIPLTLFFGLVELNHVFEYASTIGITMLLVAVLARILATSGALATGFIGGPIFPSFFVGGTLGAVFTLAFPELPIALTAGALAAAIPAAVLPIPLSISIFAILFLGLSPGNYVPVISAGVVSYVIVQSIKARKIKGRDETADS